MIVVDSSVWIDFFNGVSIPEVDRLDGLLGVTPLAIGDLILVEVLQGFRQDKDVATARQLFRSLALLPLSEGSNPWKAAENYRQLRSRGITVRKTIDGIIATACRCCSVIVISCPTSSTWAWWWHELLIAASPRQLRQVKPLPRRQWLGG